MSAIGLHSMLQFDSPAAVNEIMFSDAAAIGASHVRLDIFMPRGAVECAQWLDRIMALARSHKVRALCNLTGMPAGLGVTDDYRLPAKNPGEWAALVKNLAAQALHEPIDFEIWNEPDFRWTYLGTPYQYGQMLAESCHAIHTVNPSCMKINGGAGGNGGVARVWWAEALKAAGHITLGAFNVHLRGQESLLSSKVAQWRTFADRHGLRNVPLWVTEMGYPADANVQIDPSYQGGSVAQTRYMSDALNSMWKAGTKKLFITGRDMPPGSGAYSTEGMEVGLHDGAPPPYSVNRRSFFTVAKDFAATHR